MTRSRALTFATDVPAIVQSFGRVVAMLSGMTLTSFRPLATSASESDFDLS